MYRKEDKKQLTMEEFMLPFGGYLSADNRWVRMAKLMPWDAIEEEYANSMSETEGRKALPARMAYGAIYVKEQEGLTDERTLEYMVENPYVQYFVGLKGFSREAPFDASMMVHFRKRFPAESIQRINETLYERMAPKMEALAPQGKPSSQQEGLSSIEQEGLSSMNGDESTAAQGEGTPLCESSSAQEGSASSGDTLADGQNKGTLILDATVAPADIRYPTDLGLLNECRENAEKMIEILWPHTNRQGRKTAYNRKKARKGYMKVVKQRKPRRKVVQRAVVEQLEYVRMNLEALDRLLLCVAYAILPEADLFRLCTICQIYRQQKQMVDKGDHRCDNRIVSLRQPHVRCIVRGKARAPFEFGQKIHLSVVNGFTFI